jgi:hypothetical protein
MTEEQTTHPCAECKWRKYAEEHPKTWKARLWRWHTKICPGWRSYQRWLAQQGK